MAEINIVEEWLRSLDLIKYAESFIDNGYDDLEICKQIGEPDLDAIGVDSKEAREKLLRAIKILNEKGGSSVYLTLEDQNRNSKTEDSARLTEDEDAGTPPTPIARPHVPPAGGGDRGGARRSLVSYSRLELYVILRDKLIEDGTDLANPPYTTQNFSPCQSSLTALAVKYATELQTHFEDVVECLEDMRLWRVSEDAASIYTPPSMTSSTQEDLYNASLYSSSGRGPPPIPTVPPPDVSHLDRYGGYGELRSVHSRHGFPGLHVDNNYVALGTGMCCIFPHKVSTDKDGERKKSSVLGKLFRNIGFRRSNKKHSYKQHKGDLNASEITMSDNDRIALMQLVKEGKITTETALEVVKRYEQERRDDCSNFCSDREGRSYGRSRKQLNNKPTKSPSLIYSDENNKCEACQNLQEGPNGFPGGQGWSEQGHLFQCCRHQRVHSVSHIELADHGHSPESARAMSCSPLRTHSTQVSVLNSPVQFSPNHHSRIYSPVIPHEMKMYSGVHALYGMPGMDVLRDRLNVIKTSAYVHKTPSKVSLISSGSEHSMECSSQATTQTDLAVMRGDDLNYCSNSTVSMSSDTSPAVNGRRKYGGGIMEKMKTNKWQRSGSYSAGDDGMSTDNEDQDDIDKSLLVRNSGARMSDKIKDMKNEIKRRILQTKDIKGDGKGHQLSSAYQSPSANQSVSSTDSGNSGSSGHGSQHGASVDVVPRSWEYQSMAPILGYARVHTDYNPATDEMDFLVLRIGDRIRILEMCNTGIWKGLLDNRVGYFRFSHVDLIRETTPQHQRKDRSRRRYSRRSKPKSVEELLQRLGLQHLTNLFLLNGYDNLEIFGEIDEEDLNALNIMEPEYRAKILTAVELLTDIDGRESMDPRIRGNNSIPLETTPCSLSQSVIAPWSNVPCKHQLGSRDSGCYDSSEYLINREIMTDSYAVGKVRLPSQENKENQRPVYSASNKKGMKMSMTPTLDSTGENSGNNTGATKLSDKPSSSTKSDKCLTEEDREVCDITHGYMLHNINSDNINLDPNQDVIVNGDETYKQVTPDFLGPGWVYLLDSGTQTKHTSLTDSLLGNDMATSISCGVDLVYHGKPKPFPRLFPDNRRPVRDAQVQVMCPLGSFPPSNQSPRTVQHSDIRTCSPETPPVRCQSQNSVPVGQENLNSDADNLKYYKEHAKLRESASAQFGLDRTNRNSGQTTPEAIYGPVHQGFKYVKRSLVPRLTSKLAAEKIDLAEEPYSSQSGECGIPPLLVQRYAEELKQDLYRTALVLDQVRIHKLTTMGRPVVPLVKLEEYATATSELKISSVKDFFLSIGLPMYAGAVMNKGYGSVEDLLSLSDKEIQSVCKPDKKHLKRILHALDWVRKKLTSPTRKTKVSPVKDKV